MGIGLDLQDKATKAEVKFIRERMAESIISDLFTLLCGVGFIGIGVLLNSGAMQWAGFILFFVFLFAWSIGDKSGMIMTPQEAADWLAKEYGVKAGWERVK